MELIKNKRTGKVLFIVEGGKHEFSLIKKIFVDILDFTQIEKRRGGAKFYKRNSDKHSVIAVINTKTSNIESITEIEYLEKIFGELIQTYDFDVNNAAIYYLFDRDLESNTNVRLITDLIRVLKNSFENDDHIRGGMLILSYPSVEAYEISNFIDGSHKLCKRLGKEVKAYINDKAKMISLNKMNSESIRHAGLELKAYLEEAGIEMNLDDFSETNQAVFNQQEAHFKKTNTFRCISMLSCVLIDLGILRE